MDARRRTVDQLGSVVLAVGLLVLSAVVGWVQPQFLLVASALFVVLFLSVGVATYLVGRGVSERDKGALFRVLSSISLADSRAGARAGVLTETEVLAIESAAHEVWVYAYDLAWEDDDSPFNQLVKENLANGVNYKYLIPDVPDVVTRAKQMRLRVLGARSKGQLEIRATARERAVTQFGLTIYNPSWSDGKVPARPMAESLAVYFPHFADMAHAEVDVPFIAVQGRKTAPLIEAFVLYWDAAQPLGK